MSQPLQTWILSLYSNKEDDPFSKNVETFVFNSFESLHAHISMLRRMEKNDEETRPMKKKIK